jgi:murein tripeptide amidase MpaA
MRLLNAAQTSFPAGWQNYRAVASYDRESWFRVPTSFDGQVLTIAHTPERDSIYYAYFEPYSWERHLQLLGRVGSCPLARVMDIGSTVEGRDINLVALGNHSAEKKVWIIARQHPGEMLEGFSPQQASDQQAFIDAFKRTSPDFQTVHGYEAGKYREDMLKLASKYIGHTFKCVSLTLEMPFKDNDNLPDPEVGWNGARSARLGAAILQPILSSIAPCSSRP